MANRSDIEAGKAHVTMWLNKDKLVAGLKSFSSFNVTALTMQNWGKTDPQAKQLALLDKIYQENVYGRTG